ncbi:MAG: YncE family protein, partial [Terriglobales bacterium]
RVFNGTTLQETASTKLWDDLDPMVFDPQRNLLFTESGGGDLHQNFSHFTTIDPRTMKVVNDLPIDGTTLEWMQLAKNGPQIYLNNRARDMVTVVDRGKHAVVANWPIQGAHTNVAMAYDPAGHLIFVGCRSGQMVVLDTRNGKQIASEPLGPNVDDMVYDPASHRIYAATDGNIDVFSMTSPERYSRVEVKSAKMGKTALLVPSLRRYYVAVPQDGNTPAEILVYRVND